MSTKWDSHHMFETVFYIILIELVQGQNERQDPSTARQRLRKT